MRLLSLALLTFLASAGPVLAGGKQNVLNKVEVKDQAGSILVLIEGTQPPSFTTFSMVDPPRFVIDIAQATFKGVPEEMRVGDGTIRVIKNLSYGSDSASIARIMLSLDQEIEPPDLQATGTTLTVKIARPAGMAIASASGLLPPRFPPSPPAASPESPAPATAPTPPSLPAPPAPVAPVADIAPAPKTGVDVLRAREEAQKAEAARAKAETEARQAAGAKAKADRERLARLEAQKAEAAKAKAEAEARQAAEARAKAEQERLARLEAQKAEAAKAKAEAEARRAAEARAKAEQERLARLEAQKAEAEAKARAEAGARQAAEAKAKSDRERLARLEAQKVEAEAKARAETEARQAAEAKARAERERLARLEAQKAEAEAKARAEAGARQAAEAKAKSDREQAARLEAQQKAEAVARARPAPAPTALAQPAEPVVEEVPHSATDGKPRTVRDFGFKQVPGGSRVYVTLSLAPRFNIVEAGDKLIRIELPNTSVSNRNYNRFIDTSYFRSPVAMVTPKRQGRTMVLEIALREKAGFVHRIEGETLALDFPQTGAPGPAVAPARTPAQAPAQAAPPQTSTDAPEEAPAAPVVAPKPIP